MKRNFVPPEVCPQCGEDVPRNALACPECGADEQTGWKEDGYAADNLDLPDEEFEYEDFCAQEFGSGPKHAGTPLHWWWVAVILIAVLVLGAISMVVR